MAITLKTIKQLDQMTTVPTTVDLIVNDSSGVSKKAQLSDILSINNIPSAALERMVDVADQTARFALTTATVQNGDTVRQLDTGVMYVVVDDTKLNQEAGYKEYVAGTAAKALADESGNNIKSNYANSLEISGGNVILKNKNGTALSTQSLPSTVGTFYGVETTASASASTKTATVDSSDFALADGITVIIRFINTNTCVASAGTPIKLNVNSTGAKNIIVKNGAVPTGVNTTIFGTADFYNTYVYDGTSWVWESCSAEGITSTKTFTGTQAEWNALSNADQDMYDVINITDDNVADTTTFTGTKAQWEALSAAQKAQYLIVNLTDDDPYLIGGHDISSIADGTVSGAILEHESEIAGKQDKTDNTLTTTSKTVVGGINELNSALDSVTDEEKLWSTKTWNGLTNIMGDRVWTDGDNTYFSNYNEQYILNKSTSTWNTKTWNDLTNFHGRDIWTDGDNIYYSSGTNHYVLDKTTDTWNTKTWNGLTSFDGRNTWIDGENIYYSSGSTQYVLNKLTDTWNTKTWNGLTSFYGGWVWTDGDNIYYSDSYGSGYYILNKATSTWSTKTWSDFPVFYGECFWTDGENIYCSFETNHYVLDKTTDTWNTKTWNGLTSFNGQYIWSDGDNIYYSYSSGSAINNQYVLDKVKVTKDLGKKENASAVSGDTAFDKIATLNSALNNQLAPTSMENIDITSYTVESGNVYTAPTNGYAWGSESGQSVSGAIHVLGKDGSAFTYIQVSPGSVNAIYVLKGMKLRHEKLAVFRFIKFTY